MTNEDKQLLIKDICARLPYGVRVKRETITGSYAMVGFTLSLETFNELKVGIQEDRYSIKLYLRPMSSMSEEENIEYNEICLFNGASIALMSNVISSYETIDWLNAHHFDYRGLIEKGLALEAPEGMYD